MQILGPTQTWRVERLGQGPAGCVIGSPSGLDACSRARTGLGSGTRRLGIWSQKRWNADLASVWLGNGP